MATIKGQTELSANIRPNYPLSITSSTPPSVRSETEHEGTNRIALPEPRSPPHPVYPSLGAPSYKKEATEATTGADDIALEYIPPARVGRSVLARKSKEEEKVVGPLSSRVPIPLDELNAFYDKMEKKQADKKPVRGSSLWERKSQPNPSGNKLQEDRVYPYQYAQYSVLPGPENNQSRVSLGLSRAPPIVPDVSPEGAAQQTQELEWATLSPIQFRAQYPIHNPVGPRFYKNHNLFPPPAKDNHERRQSVGSSALSDTTSFLSLLDAKRSSVSNRGGANGGKFGTIRTATTEMTSHLKPDPLPFGRTRTPMQEQQQQQPAKLFSQSYAQPAAFPYST